MSDLNEMLATIEEHEVDDHIGRHGWGVVAKKLLQWLRYFMARSRLWKRAAKKWYKKFFELHDDCEVIDSTSDYWERTATRRLEVIKKVEHELTSMQENWREEYLFNAYNLLAEELARELADAVGSES